LRILAVQSSIHDCSAAAFDDYKLVAAVSEERLTRVKGQGGLPPWLAIDEVLRIAGWRRNDVDAIATTRGLCPTYYERFSLFRDLHYTLQRWRGR
jgi:carbamoyltransferase